MNNPAKISAILPLTLICHTNLYLLKQKRYLEIMTNSTGRHRTLLAVFIGCTSLVAQIVKNLPAVQT